MLEDLLGHGKDPLVHQTSGLFRSASRGTSEYHDDMSDGSESSQCCVSTRRIAIAKQILAEAMSAYTPSFSISALKSNKCRNTGAMGPLLAMLEEQQEPEKTHFCLETLAFLLLDRANRKIVADLSGVDTILRTFARVQDPTIRTSALNSLASLVKHDNEDKAHLWAHPSKTAVLELIRQKQPASQQLEVMCYVNKIAFRTGAGNTPVQLLEPRLLTAMSELLHPTAHPSILSRALRFFHMAAVCAESSHLPHWHTAAFHLVPLLSLPATVGMLPSAQHAPLQEANTSESGGANGGSCKCSGSTILEAVLEVLMTLAERPAFRNALFAAGVLNPIMLLLTRDSKPVRVAAACILSSLSDSAMCMEQLGSETALVAMLRALNSVPCAEISIGVLYVLGRLAAARPHATVVLRHCGAVPLLHKVQQTSPDVDVVLGAAQLLELLQVQLRNSAARAPVSCNTLPCAAGQVTHAAPPPVVAAAMPHLPLSADKAAGAAVLSHVSKPPQPAHLLKPQPQVVLAPLKSGRHAGSPIQDTDVLSVMTAGRYHTDATVFLSNMCA